MNATQWISYPGDDGTEPAEIRKQKADEYATRVVKSATRVATGGIMPMRDVNFTYKPYPLAEISNVFTAETFAAMRSDWPDMTEAKGLANNAYNKRSISMRTNSALFQKVTKNSPIWKELSKYIEAPEFIRRIVNMLDENAVELGLSDIRPVKYRSPFNRLRRPLARLLKRNYLAARMEFSAMPSDGGQIAPHTDMPSKIMTIVINIDGQEDGFIGGTSIVEPKDESKIHNPSNGYLGFDEVTELRRVDFKRNCGLLFIRTDNSWHCVFPISRPEGGFRRSININIESIG